MSRTIAVIGATGNQGRGVVASLLSTTDVSVRAITRDTTSDQAKALGTDARLSLVQADLDDVESLKKALEGVQGVFGMTTAGPTEVQQGRNLVDAVKAAGVEHFVFSGLPSIAQASAGRFQGVFHFDMKSAVEQYAKEQLTNVTVVVPGVFYGDLARPFYTQRQADGSVRFCLPSNNPQPAVGWLDASDVGVYVAAIFSKPLSLTSGKTYPAMTSSPGPLADFAATYAAKTGDKVVLEPVTRDEVAAALAGLPGGEMIATAAFDMFDYLDTTAPGTTCYGTMQASEDPTAADLGVKATSFEAWLEKTGWKA
ncbi:hypothetical protein JCM10207_004195 [Rhodosporidiobolus poonsookiae]